MTIPFEKFKARLLTNPKVRAEYDALAPEFPIAVELVSRNNPSAEPVPMLRTKSLTPLTGRAPLPSADKSGNCA
jgi:hypothetical protein